MGKDRSKIQASILMGPSERCQIKIEIRKPHTNFQLDRGKGELYFTLTSRKETVDQLRIFNGRSENFKSFGRSFV
jgi:hypothetical protein